MPDAIRWSPAAWCESPAKRSIHQKWRGSDG
jgi:hypothetical protein